MPHIYHVSTDYHAVGYSLKLYNPGISWNLPIFDGSDRYRCIPRLGRFPRQAGLSASFTGPVDLALGGERRGGLLIRGRHSSVCRGLESVIITSLLVESRFGRFAASFSPLWHPGSMGNARFKHLSITSRAENTRIFSMLGSSEGYE